MNWLPSVPRSEKSRKQNRKSRLSRQRRHADWDTFKVGNDGNPARPRDDGPRVIYRQRVRVREIITVSTHVTTVHVSASASFQHGVASFP